LTELTSVTGAVAASSLTSAMPSSKLPAICSTSAPWISACASLPSAILPSGISTKDTMPARAA